jgi:hypothetical protein
MPNGIFLIFYLFMPFQLFITFQRNARSLSLIAQKKGLAKTFLLSYSTYETDRYTITTMWYNGTFWYIMPYSGTHRFFTGSRLPGS